MCISAANSVCESWGQLPCVRNGRTPVSSGVCALIGGGLGRIVRLRVGDVASNEGFRCFREFVSGPIAWYAFVIGDPDEDVGSRW